MRTSPLAKDPLCTEWTASLRAIGCGRVSRSFKGADKAVSAFKTKMTQASMKTKRRTVQFWVAFASRRRMASVALRCTFAKLYRNAVLSAFSTWKTRDQCMKQQLFVLKKLQTTAKVALQRRTFNSLRIHSIVSESELARSSLVGQIARHSLRGSLKLHLQHWRHCIDAIRVRRHSVRCGIVSIGFVLTRWRNRRLLQVLHVWRSVYVRDRAFCKVFREMAKSVASKRTNLPSCVWAFKSGRDTRISARDLSMPLLRGEHRIKRQLQALGFGRWQGFLRARFRYDWMLSKVKRLLGRFQARRTALSFEYLYRYGIRKESKNEGSVHSKESDGSLEWPPHLRCVGALEGLHGAASNVPASSTSNRFQVLEAHNA